MLRKTIRGRTIGGMDCWPRYRWRYGLLSLAIHAAPLLALVRFAVTPPSASPPLVVALWPRAEAAPPEEERENVASDAEVAADTEAEAECGSGCGVRTRGADADAKAEATTRVARVGGGAHVGATAKLAGSASAAERVLREMGSERSLDAGVRRTDGSIALAVVSAVSRSEPGVTSLADAGDGEGATDALRPWARPGSAIATAVTRMMPLVHWSSRSGFGAASVSFTVTRQGYVEGLTFKRSSGNANIDRATREAIHMAEPFGFVAGAIVLDVDFKAGAALLQQGRERFGFDDRQDRADKRFGKTVMVGGPGAGTQLAAQ